MKRHAARLQRQTSNSMATPQFIRDLRAHIGHAELWLPGVSAFVIQDEQILLVRRKDNNQWTPITGICDPGEQPDIAACRECLEETGVQVEPVKVIWVQAVGPVTYPNNDVASYMDIAFLCRPTAGHAHVADDENSEVRWFHLDDLPPMKARFTNTLQHALKDEPTRWGNSL